MPATGEPSDRVPAVLATGRTEVTTVVASLSARHPEGRDAEYLAWHTLDHRPEQHRLPGLRGSLRVVSTAACRTVRAAAVAPYDAVDHVMVYLFTSRSDLRGFGDLGAALRTAGRMPDRLPAVDLSVHELDATVAAAEVLVGADVLPWRPGPGLFVLLEDGTAPPADLVAVTGVAGAWSARGTDGHPLATAGPTGHRLTLCFLDDDPVAVAARLAPCLQRRWDDGTVRPLLAAPFLTVVPGEWDRRLPST